MSRIKSFTSAAISGALALSLCSSYCGLLTEGRVYAGEQLGQTNFDNGVGLPWHICESETGKMEFEVKDGKYQITIVNPGGKSNGGEDRWDCQFRHRGLKMVAGHQYKISYEITATNPGQYYTKIGNLEGDVEVWHSNTNEGDFGANWGMIQLQANHPNKVSMTFTPTQSLDVAEWAFHLGGDGQFTQGVCFPAGTVITFDNMSLIDTTSNENDYVDGENWERASVLVNQLGYFPKGEKKATLLSDSSKSVNFEVFDANDKSVFKGKSTPAGKDADSGDDVHIIDFSDFDGEGDDFYIVADGGESHRFSVKNNFYSNMLYDSLNYFYQNRSGVPIDSQYISSGDASSLARAAGHVSDICTTDLCWGYSDNYQLDVTGGWYDAGDHGKYVVNGGISLWTMQNQYERSLYVKGVNQDLYGDGALNIPESGNGVPDILDEARVELEWMLKMMVPEGKKYEGMVHHKVHDEKWTGLATAPADDTKTRIIKPPTTTATLNLAACAAQGYRLWKDFDKAFADECLESAKKAYEAAKKNPSMFAPLDESTGGGAYGDNNADDEFYWAACELYLATGDKSYYKDLTSSDYEFEVGTELNGGEDNGLVGSFDWGNVAALGTMSLATVQDGISDKEMKTITKNFKEASQYYIDLENEQGYGVPIKAAEVDAGNGKTVNGYPWGSNSFVMNTAMIMAYAYDLTGTEDYLDGARTALDYIMGRNPLDNCYVTGYGTHSSKNPHHRWWSNQVDDKFPSAPDGVLVGGPNSGLQDPWVKGLGYESGELAPQLCYVDHVEAWSTNECTINWNAPLAWMTGFFTDEPIREVKALKYDDSEEKDEDEDTAEVTEKKQEKKTSSIDDDDDSDSKRSSKNDIDDNENELKDNIIDLGKKICMYVGAGVIGLLVAIGLVNGIITLIKGAIKKGKNKKNN